MRKDRGIAYCGLACAVCSENGTCVGCRNEGCRDKDRCENLRCCRAKGLEGCWECGDFPCEGTMLDKMRIRAFARFIKRFGVETLLGCLGRNEKAGIVYHYPGSLTGDYDSPGTEEEIIDMISTGIRRSRRGNEGTLGQG